MSRGSESNRLAKECIVTALVELMKIREYDSITITDIAKKAGGMLSESIPPASV